MNTLGPSFTSDVAFAFWNRAVTAATRTNLKYIISYQILNDDTEDVVNRALAAVNAGHLGDWPGTDFEFAFRKAMATRSKRLWRS